MLKFFGHIIWYIEHADATQHVKTPKIHSHNVETAVHMYNKRT